MEKHAESQRSSRPEGFFGFTRVDLSVPLFIFAGLGAAFISAMGAMAWGYDSRPNDISALISHIFLLLFFPAFLAAILERRFASLPLWFCFIALIAAGLKHPTQAIETSRLKGEGELLTVVLLTEAARLIRGRRPGAVPTRRSAED